MGIVGQDNSRSQENIVFYGGVLRDVDIAMNSHAIAGNAVVVNRGVIPNGTIVPDTIPFSDDHSMACFKPIADFYRGVNNGPGPNLRVIPDPDRFSFNGASRRIAQDDAWIDRAVLS